MASPPQYCPVCGEAVPPRAKACPECGADERSGWNEETLIYDGVDLPDEAWGDDPPNPSGNRDGSFPLVWKITAAILVIAVILYFAF